MTQNTVPLKRKIIRRTPCQHTSLGSCHPVLDAVYRNRAITDANEIDYSLSRLHPPHLISNINEAAAIIVEAIQADASILIAGDYDADGATGCALGVLCLKAFGARHIAFACPNRLEHGYGLTERFVRYIADTEPDLIITVDNGISNVEGVDLAKEFGLSVIITDHHLPGETLPKADAIVNPQLPGDKFPSKHLAGVGVLFYLMLVVRTQLVKQNWFKQEGIAVPNMGDFLDLVALGTVADLVPLDYNNRILVSQGLKRINRKDCRIGIRFLLEAGGKTIGSIVSEDLAFQAGPRLNAAGRLADIGLGVNCLIVQDRKEALKLSEKLDAFNLERKKKEELMFKQANQELAAYETVKDNGTVGNCLFDASWHQGIVGIIASRIKQQTSRPTFAFAPGDEGTLRGSGRSVIGLNLRDLLASIATAYPEMFIAFGGHAMAAGVTLPEYNYKLFKQQFEEILLRHQQDIGWRDEILSDGELLSIDVETAEQIRTGGPWGQAFEAPIFDGEFEILEYALLKDKHLKLKLYSPKHDENINAIYFFYTDHHVSEPQFATYYFAYKLVVNEFNGRKTPQLYIVHMTDSVAATQSVCTKIPN